MVQVQPKFVISLISFSYFGLIFEHLVASLYILVMFNFSFCDEDFRRKEFYNSDCMLKNVSILTCLHVAEAFIFGAW
jgi:hypothetical protein